MQDLPPELDAGKDQVLLGLLWIQPLEQEPGGLRGSGATLLLLRDWDELVKGMMGEFLHETLQKPALSFWVRLWVPAAGTGWTWVNGSRQDWDRGVPGAALGAKGRQPSVPQVTPRGDPDSLLHLKITAGPQGETWTLWDDQRQHHHPGELRLGFAVDLPERSHRTLTQRMGEMLRRDVGV